MKKTTKIEKTLPEEVINELFRFSYLSNAQKVVLKVVSEAKDFNEELYTQEKAKFLEYTAAFELLLQSVLIDYFNLHVDNNRLRLYSFEINAADNIFTIIGPFETLDSEE